MIFTSVVVLLLFFIPTVCKYDSKICWCSSLSWTWSAGNWEGAKIHAQNAIRKKSEQLNWLQLASRLDATVSRLEEQSKMGNLNRTMTGVVKSLNKALKGAPLEKVVTVSTATCRKQICSFVFFLARGML